MDEKTVTTLRQRHLGTLIVINDIPHLPLPMTKWTTEQLNHFESLIEFAYQHYQTEISWNDPMHEGEEFIEDALKRYQEQKQNGTSIAGERVVIHIIQSVYSEEEQGIRVKMVFDVIGTISEKLIEHKTMEVFPLNKEIKKGGLELLCPYLLQLYYSGCFATEDDEMNCAIALETLAKSQQK